MFNPTTFFFLQIFRPQFIYLFIDKKNFFFWLIWDNSPYLILERFFRPGVCLIYFSYALLTSSIPSCLQPVMISQFSLYLPLAKYFKILTTQLWSLYFSIFFNMPKYIIYLLLMLFSFRLYVIMALHRLYFIICELLWRLG